MFGFNEHGGGVRAVAYSSDGQRVASASVDRSVIIWNVVSGEKEAVLNGHNTRVTGVTFAPDGTWLASCDQERKIICWDLATQRPRWETPKGGSSTSLASSPNGRWLAPSSAILDSRNGRVLFDGWQFHPAVIYGNQSFAFSADNRRVAAVGNGVALLSTEDWNVLAQHPMNNDRQIISVGFSPDSRTLVTGDDEGYMRRWEAASLRLLATLGHHATRIKSVAFSPVDQLAVTAGDDNMIKVWEVSWRRRFLPRLFMRDGRIGTHSAPVLAVALSPDDTQLVAGGHDSKVRLYTRHRTRWGWRLD